MGSVLYVTYCGETAVLLVREGREGGRREGGREGGPLLTGTVEYDAVAVTVSYLMMGVLFDWFVKLRVRLGYVNGG